MGGCCCCAVARNAVSKKKRRIKLDQTEENKDEVPKGGVDLDLTRIHPNIICMGFPSSGFESWYRNPYPEVLTYLDHIFPDERGQYRVINLCSEKQHQYDKTKYFHGQCYAYPFKDMTPCTLETIPVCMEESMRHVHFWRQDAKSSRMHKPEGESQKGGEEREEEKGGSAAATTEPVEMKEQERKEGDNENGEEKADGVVAIHCKAGKGRTGLMACCLLLALDESMDTDTALENYAKARTQNARGLTHRSQRRYVRYWEKLVKQRPGGQMPAEIPRVLLKKISLDSLLQECGTGKFKFLSITTYQPAYGCLTIDCEAAKKAKALTMDETTGSAVLDLSALLKFALDDSKSGDCVCVNDDYDDAKKRGPPLMSAWDSNPTRAGLVVQGDLRIELLAAVGAKWIGALHVHTLFLEKDYGFLELDTMYKSQKLPEGAKISLDYEDNY